MLPAIYPGVVRCGPPLEYGFPEATSFGLLAMSPFPCCLLGRAAAPLDPIGSLPVQLCEGPDRVIYILNAADKESLRGPVLTILKPGPGFGPIQNAPEGRRQYSMLDKRHYRSSSTVVRTAHGVEIGSDPMLNIGIESDPLPGVGVETNGLPGAAIMKDRLPGVGILNDCMPGVGIVDNRLPGAGILNKRLLDAGLVAVSMRSAVRDSRRHGLNGRALYESRKARGAIAPVAQHMAERYAKRPHVRGLTFTRLLRDQLW